MNDARLLIVEDNDEIAQMLVLFFSSRGLKVSVASDGDTALRVVRDVLPTLVLLDVGLPDTDGYELCRQFRQGVRTRYIPVIFLTRRSKKADRLAGLQLGADDFITKPFDLEELFLRVQNAIARAAREHLSDPNTGLPANKITTEEIERARSQAGRVALQLRLRNLAPFRDLYGALAGADLLRYISLLINRVLNAVGASDDFLGQLDEETFAIVCAIERAALIEKNIHDHFHSDVIRHYNMGERVSEDLIQVIDSGGQVHQLPALKLEITRLF